MDRQNYLNFIKENRKKLISSATPYEQRLLQVLKSKGIKHNFQHIIQVDGGIQYIVDFFLPQKDVVIEVNGGYHNKPEQVEKDKKRKWALEKMGYKVLVIRNEQLTNKTSQKDIVETLNRKYINYMPSIYYKPKGLFD